MSLKSKSQQNQANFWGYENKHNASDAIGI